MFARVYMPHCSRHFFGGWFCSLIMNLWQCLHFLMRFVYWHTSVSAAICYRNINIVSVLLIYITAAFVIGRDGMVAYRKMRLTI